MPDSGAERETVKTHGVLSVPLSVVERDGMLIMVDDERMPLRDGEAPSTRNVRFRTLGCYPLTGAVESVAASGCPGIVAVQGAIVFGIQSGVLGGGDGPGADG